MFDNNMTQKPAPKKFPATKGKSIKGDGGMGGELKSTRKSGGMPDIKGNMPFGGNAGCSPLGNMPFKDTARPNIKGKAAPTKLVYK